MHNTVKADDNELKALYAAEITSGVLDPTVTTFDSFYNSKMLDIFIGKPERRSYYESAFLEFDQNGFKWIWSWWGFFANTFFLFYRKAYPYAIVTSILVIFLTRIDQPNDESIHNAIIMIYFMMSVMVGGMAPYLIYQRYMKIKLQIESETTNWDARIKMMKKQGGYLKIPFIILIFIGLNFMGIFLMKIAQ